MLVETAIELGVIVVGTVSEVVMATENVTGWYGARPWGIDRALATWTAEIGILDTQSGLESSKR